MPQKGVLIRIGGIRPDRLYAFARSQVQHDGSSQVHRRTSVLRDTDQPKAENVFTDSRCAIRWEADGVQVLGRELEAVVWSRHEYRHGDEAQFPILEALHEYQRAVLRLVDKQESILILEAGYPGGERKDGRRIIFQFTEISGH